MIEGLDMNQLLEKAKEVQKTFAKKKEEAASKTVDVEVGAGMVKVQMNGNLELTKITLDPDIVDKNDIETLEDLVRSAINEATRQAKELGTSGLADLMGNMNLDNLPGMGK